MFKRGQALNAAIIIFVVLVMVLIYVYFLPPTEKEFLVNGQSYNYSLYNSSYYNSTNFVIFDKRIGHISPQTPSKIEHDLVPFSVFYNEQYSTIVSKAQLLLYNSWYDSNSFEYSFKLDPKYVKSDIFVDFQYVSGNSDLKFFFNNHLVYVGKQGFRIPKDFVRKKNKLVVQVSSTGINPFGLNKVLIANFRMFSDVVNPSNSLQNISLFLDPQEVLESKKAEAQFYIECINNKDNHLLIKFNNYLLFNSSPICGNLYKFTIPSTSLHSQMNYFVFKSGSGNYFIKNFVFYTYPNENGITPFYFDVPESVYNEIKANHADLNLSISFVNPSNNALDINVNGFSREITATDYWYIITPYVKEKNNYVFINSTVPLDISDLRISVVSKN